MLRRFRKRWMRASRTARWAVVQSIGLPAFCFILGGSYIYFMYHPLPVGAPSHVFGSKRSFGMLACSPNPYIRVPFDLFFSAIFVLAGIFFCDGLDAYFALDRWKPPMEDPAKVDTMSADRLPAPSKFILTGPFCRPPATKT